MTAQIIPFRPRESVALRYAKLIAIKYNECDRDEVIADQLEFADGLVARGFTAFDLEDMIKCTRDRLRRELREIENV